MNPTEEVSNYIRTHTYTNTHTHTHTHTYIYIYPMVIPSKYITTDENAT